MSLNKIFPVICFLTMLFGTGVQAQQKVPESQIAFQSGERMVFAVSYKWGVINTDVANVEFSVKNSSVDGTAAYAVTAVGETYSFYKYMFDMRDVYQTWLDKETLRPIYFKNNIKEGNYRMNGTYHYDWNKMQVLSEYKRPAWEAPQTKVLKLSNQSFDGVALFYNLRNTDLSKLKPGFRDKIQIVLKDTVRTLEYKFLAKEVKDIPGMGRFNTIKFSCQLAVSDDDDSFKNGSEFFVWFSDDQNKIPLYLESPIRVGSVKARLVEYQGLKYDLKSKIK